MLRRFLAVLALVATLATLVTPRRANAGWVWDGHTWTVAIVSAIGAAAVGYFLAYESAMLRSKGSVKQGETVMRLTLFGSPKGIASSPDPRQLSLQALRGIVMADVAYELTAPNINPATQTNWRTNFETLRSCWNTALVTPPTPAPSSSSSPTSSPTSSPSSTPKESKKKTSSKKTKGQKTPSPRTSQTTYTGRSVVVAYDSSRLEMDTGLAPVQVGYTGSPPPSHQPSSHHPPSHHPSGKPTAKPRTKSTSTPSPSPSPSSSPSPSPSPSSTPAKPTCSDLFNDVMNSYQGDIKKANQLFATNSGAPSPTPLSSADAEALAFRLQTQIDTTDLAAYLSTSPSLLSQVVNQNVGSYVTDDYVRNLFLATAAIEFINALPTPTPIPGTKGIAPPQFLSLLQPVASDCTGINAVASGLKCLNDVSSIEVAFANAHIQREACYWSKHVIMPTYSDIDLWAKQRGPYTQGAAAALGRSAGSTPPPTKALIKVNLGNSVSGSLSTIDPDTVFINGLGTGSSYEPTSPKAVDATNAINADMTVLTMPSGC